jgi:hypothetical protein
MDTLESVAIAAKAEWDERMAASKFGFESVATWKKWSKI